MTPRTYPHYGVIGLGPIGTIVASFLIQSGCRVSALCGYPAKYEALRKHPVRVLGALQAEAKFTELHMEMSKFLAAKPDVICIATKSADSPAILKVIKETDPFCSAVFVSCQNGLDVERPMIDLFGRNHTLRMALNLGAALQGENHV